MPHASVHHVHATGLQPCTSCLLTCPTASPSCVCWVGCMQQVPPAPLSPPLTTLTTPHDGTVPKSQPPLWQPGLACCTPLATFCRCAGTLPPSSLYPGTPHRYHGAGCTPCARLAARPRGLVGDRVGGWVWSRDAMAALTPYPSPPPRVLAVQPYAPVLCPPRGAARPGGSPSIPLQGSQCTCTHTHTVQEVCTWGVHGVVVCCDGVPRWTALLHLHSLGPWAV